MKEYPVFLFIVVGNFTPPLLLETKICTCGWWSRNAHFRRSMKLTGKVREWWRGRESRGLAPGDLKAKKREGRKRGSVDGTNGREVRSGWRWREEK